MDKGTEKTITITPNYSNLFNNFKRDAELHMQSFAQPLHKEFTRKQVYDFIASFRVALGCITKMEDFEALRDSFDKGAEVMFAQVTKEQNEEWESEEDNSRPVWDGKSSGGGTFERGE